MKQEDRGVKNKSSKSVGDNQSEAVYSRRGPTNSRTLGSTLDHSHPSIPSSTFRTLEQSIPSASLRTHEHYEWNPKTGDSHIVKEKADLLSHTQRHIDRGKFHTVTSGARQRYRKAENQSDDQHHSTPMSVCSPAILGGSMSSGKKRNRKDRY